jgi:hypothetical protein
MIYKSYVVALFVRVVVLSAALMAFTYGMLEGNTYALYGGAFCALFFFIRLYRFVTRRFVAMDDFFEAVKYRDFSRWFSEKHGTQDMPLNLLTTNDRLSLYTYKKFSPWSM